VQTRNHFVAQRQKNELLDRRVMTIYLCGTPPILIFISVEINKLLTNLLILYVHYDSNIISNKNSVDLLYSFYYLRQRRR